MRSSLKLAAVIALSLPARAVRAQDPGWAGLPSALEGARGHLRSFRLETIGAQRRLPPPEIRQEAAVLGRLLHTVPLGPDSIADRHLRTGLKVRAGNGAEYSLGAQRSRVTAPGQPTAYLTFHREGMREPVLVDIRQIATYYGFLWIGGHIDEVAVEGQKFQLKLKANPADADCRNPPLSRLRVWPENHESRAVQFSILEAFQNTGRAGSVFHVPSAESPGGSLEASLVYYRDPPFDSAQASVAFLIGEPWNVVRSVPVEWLSADGSVLTSAVHARRFGVRLMGRALEFYEMGDVPGAGPLPRDIPVEARIPRRACP